MRIIIIGFLVFFILTDTNNAQWDPGPVETFEEAWEYFSYNEYQEALSLLNSLYPEEENNSHLQYLIGVCYLNIEGQKQRALPFLEKAAEKITTRHQAGNFNEKSAPLESLYYLGIAYRLRYRFDESLETFERLRNLAGKHYDMQQVERQKIITKNAERFYMNKEEVITLSWENKPPVYPFHKNIIISGDELTIVYTEEQQFYDAVFYTKYEEDSWTKPVNITMHIQSDGLAYPACLSWDGTELYLYQYDRFSNTNLYISQLMKDSWSVMENLGNNINSEAFEQHATITKDGKTIYFASSRTPGNGGFDIYRSVLNEDQQWGSAENLGYPLNTIYDESFPFISPDGNTLYFSSKGHTGMGGYDIFISQKSPSGKWSVPRNLGFPFNTPDDDAFLIPVNNGATAYFNKRTNKNTDVREFRKIKSFEPDMTSSAILEMNISATSFSADSFPGLMVRLERTEPFDSIITISGDGKIEDYELELPWGKYLLEAYSPAYEKKAIDIIIHEYYPEEKYTVTARLDLLKEEANAPGIPENRSTSSAMPTDRNVLKIQPAFFGFDSYAPNEESQHFILKIAGAMNEHKDMTVELIAYTDALGPAAYNEYLSGRRAETVADILASQGVERERIKTTAAGMGNYIAKNTTREGRDNPHGRKYNRRVEFKFSNVPEILMIDNTLNLPDHLKNH